MPNFDHFPPISPEILVLVTVKKLPRGEILTSCERKQAMRAKLNLLIREIIGIKCQDVRRADRRLNFLIHETKHESLLKD